MKRSLVLCLILLLILPLATAVEFDMKDEFQKGETLLAKVSGNFIKPVLKENILFYRGHVRVSIDAYVAKINDEFYIYAILPETSNNYSIKIENVEYMQGSQSSDEDLIKNFTITDETTDFSVKPGFVVAEKNFTLELQNLQDKKITVDIKTNAVLGQGFFAALFGDGTEDDDGKVEIKSGDTEKINFNVEKGEDPTLKLLELSSENTEYEIPIYIFKTGEGPDKEKFKLDPGELEIFVPVNTERIRTIYFSNTGSIILENISLSLSDSLIPYMALVEDEINEVEDDESEKIELVILSGNLAQIVEGQLTATLEDGTHAYTLIILNIVSDFIPDQNPSINPDIAATQTCEALGGKIREDNEKCNDEIATYAQDSICCMNECEEQPSSSTGKIIGWLLVLIVIGFVAWFFFKRYKTAVKKDVDFKQFDKKK